MVFLLLVVAAGCSDDTPGNSDNGLPDIGLPDVGQPDVDEADTPDNPDEPDADDEQDAPDPPEDVPEPPEDVPDPPEDVPDPPEDVPDVPDEEDATEGEDVEDEQDTPEPLRILSVTPDRGSIEGGTEVTLTVQGELEEPGVQFDGRDATEVRLVNPTTITAVTPPGIIGPADVKVINGQERDTLTDGFVYVAPMSIELVEPSRGSSDGGDLIEVRGEAFPQDVQVSFGGRAAVSVQWLSAERLLAISPPGVAGIADVRVTDLYSSAVLPEGYTYFDAVKIDSLFPAAGPQAGGQVTVISGQGLTAQTTVSFGAIEAQVRHINDQRLEVTTPPGPLGAVDVLLVNGNGAAGLPRGYTYLNDDQQGLAVTGVQPDRGPAAGGQEVIISGRGFDDDDLVVTFGGEPAQLIEVTDSALRVRTPAGETGEVDVVVTNAQGEQALTDGYTYLVTLELAAVEPADGPVEGGTPVRIFGNGFDQQTRFFIGPQPVQQVIIENDTTATGLTPPGSLGLNPVRAERGVQQAVLPEGFRYTAPAEIYSIEPQRGSIAGGTTLTIRGRGFVQGAAVQIGALGCDNPEVLDPATIVCTTAEGREGAFPVQIEQGGQMLQAPERYIYFNPASRFGGAWGDAVGGSVNISVFSIGGEAVPGAFVMLTVDGDSQYQGFTNEQGLITFSGDDVLGNQFVSATAASFSSATMQTIDAENITLLLFPVVPPSGGGGGGGIPLATITGQVSGFQKIAEPGPDERQLIIVETTRQSPFRGNPWPGNGNVVDPNGDRTYTLNSRIGDLAVIAWGGLINDRTGDFTPYAMGIRRYLFVSQDETYNVDIELNIDLDHRMNFKLNGIQQGEPGPTINRVTPWVDLGFEGVFGNYDLAEGDGDILVAEHQARLEGDLADARYYIYGGSYTNRGSPYAQSVLTDVTQIDGLIELPELIGIPQPLLPLDGDIAVDGYVAFEPMTNNLPDFWHVQIYQLPATLVWEITMPGEQTWFHLPRFPDFSDLPIEERPTPYAYDGNLYMIVSGARIDDFDFDRHEYLNDIRSRDRWTSWTRNAYFIGIE